MNRSKLLSATIVLLAWLPCIAGCGGKEETVAPEKMEESRQKMIDRTERMRQDMQQKK